MQKNLDLNYQILASTKVRKHCFLTCKVCSVQFKGNGRSLGFCSTNCAKISKSHEKFNGVNDLEYIECPVCKLRTTQINNVHAKMHGFSSPVEMQKHFNMPTLFCNSIKRFGKDNHASEHGGKYSKWSSNFLHGYSKDAHDEFSKNHSVHRNDPLHKYKYMTNIEYWVKEANGNETLAKELYSKFQTRDLDYFVDKYGQEEGTIRHSTKTAKWVKSYKKQNFSKVSQVLFEEIMLQIIDKVDIENVYFATFDRDDMKGYQNKEYRLQTGTSYIFPDFILLDKKRIIEFDGSYWHGKQSNPLREQIRDNKIHAAGYTVMHVLEENYKKNKHQVIQECINFLTQ